MLGLLAWSTILSGARARSSKRAIAEPNACGGAAFQGVWVGRFCSSKDDLWGYRTWYDLCWIRPVPNLPLEFPMSWQIGSSPAETLANGVASWWHAIDDYMLEPGVMSEDRIPTEPGISYTATRFCPFDYVCMGYPDDDGDPHIVCRREKKQDPDSGDAEYLRYIEDQHGHVTWEAMDLFGLAQWRVIAPSRHGSDSENEGPRSASQGIHVDAMNLKASTEFEQKYEVQVTIEQLDITGE